MTTVDRLQNLDNPVAVINADCIVITELKRPCLEWLYEQIGSSRVDVATALRDGQALDMWFDDEFLYRDEITNDLAARVAVDLAVPLGPEVRGPVVITGANVDGETVRLDVAALELLLAAAKDLPVRIT